MTLTLRIDDNSNTVQELEIIKKYFDIKTNSDAIIRAISYFSKFADHKLDKELRIANYQKLEAEINQYKQAIRNYWSSLNVLDNLALKE
jgi:hypothetical protein